MDGEIAAEMHRCRQEVEEKLTRMMEEHYDEEAARYDIIQKQLVEVRQQLAELLEAFQQARGVLLAIKWITAAIAVMWTLIIWARDHLRL